MVPWWRRRARYKSAASPSPFSNRRRSAWADTVTPSSGEYTSTLPNSGPSSLVDCSLFYTNSLPGQAPVENLMAELLPVTMGKTKGLKAVFMKKRYRFFGSAAAILLLWNLCLGPFPGRLRPLSLGAGLGGHPRRLLFRTGGLRSGRGRSAGAGGPVLLRRAGPSLHAAAKGSRRR